MKNPGTESQSGHRARNDRSPRCLALLLPALLFAAPCAERLEYIGCGVFSDSGSSNTYPRYRIDLPTMDFGERSTSRCEIVDLPDADATPPWSIRLFAFLLGDSTSDHDESTTRHLQYTLRMVILTPANGSAGEDFRILDVLEAAGARVEMVLSSPADEKRWSGSPDAGLSTTTFSGEDFLQFSYQNELYLSAGELRGSTVELRLYAESPDLLEEIELRPALLGGGWRP